MRALAYESHVVRPRAPLHLTIVFALLAVVGCSSKDPVSPAAPSAPPTQVLGTPLTAPDAVEVESSLMWSSLTGELICSASFLTARASLLAIHSTTKATRVLEALPSIVTDMAPDGSAVYFNALGDDYSLGRRSALAGSFAPALLDSCSLLCFFYMRAAPDGDHVAVERISFSSTTDVSDSLRIHVLSTGERKAFASAVPVAFSPGSDQLVVNDVFAPLSQAAILTLATRGTQPAGLSVPDPIAESRVRWGPSGIEVLYVEADDKRLFLHQAAGGTTTLIWSSADSLRGPMAWSESGRQAAIWSSRDVGTDAVPVQRWELHVVDLGSHNARTVAYAEVPTRSAAVLRPVPRPVARLRAMADIFPPPRLGGLVFSPDETKLAYTFFDGRVYRSDLSGSMASAAR